MERLRGFPRRFRFPWRSAATIRRDVDDELAFHLLEKIDALERQGLRSEEAREEALRQFGDVRAARERLVAEDRRGERRSIRLMMLDDFVRDIRFAWRSLRRTPGFTAAAVLVLALGIGVVSGAATAINVIALKPAMMADPDDVLGVFAMRDAPREWRFFSYPEYEEIRERADAFSSIAAFDIAEAGVDTGGTVRRGQVAFVSASYFETLGVPLARGRAFTLAEERGEEPPAAVISHDLWTRSGADPGVLGSIVRVNGVPLTIVGVAPDGFTGTMAIIATDVFMPLAAMERVRAAEQGAARRLRDPRHGSLMLVGRLAEGADAADADGELAALAALSDANTAASAEERYTYVTGKIGRTSFGSAPATGGDGPGPALLLPAAMSVIVLLIACLNLANMFLARGASRRTEIAIRQSLGSGRFRVIRQLLTEGLLLAVLGGLGGLALSYWAARWIVVSAANAVPMGLQIDVDIRPDTTVLLVTAFACVLAALLFGLGPAWRVTGADVLSGLKEGAGSVRFGRRIGRTRFSGRNALMVGQVALTLAMLTVGGLFARSALFAGASAPSFSLDRTLVVEIDPSLVGYDETRSKTLYAQILERVRALPEVENAGAATIVPLSGISSGTAVRPAGAATGERGYFATRSAISDGYFDALRLPIRRGRDFTPDEVFGESSRPVAIIDEPLARRLFPNADPVGQRIRVGRAEREIEIVAVAPGTPGESFDPASTAHLYLPLGQAYEPGMSLLVGVSEHAADPAGVLETIRREARAIDPALPVLEAATMRQVRDRNWTMWLLRLGGQLFTVLGVLALFVAMVGLYGMRAFLLSRRTREIGVRVALGATRGALLRQMMGESTRVTLVGLAVGLVLALALGRVLASLLYQVRPTDPWALLGATAFLAAAATVTGWLPVRKALRVQPSAALRYE